MSRPELNEYAGYFERYINLVKGDNLLENLQGPDYFYFDFFKAIPEVKQNYAYAPDKWTVKEVLQHLIDCERIFAFRALSFARGEMQSLSGFDENSYATESKATERNWEELCTEYESVRLSSISLFRSFTPEMLMQSGMASSNKLSVRAIGFIICGHTAHHKKVLEERYELV